MTAKHTPGDRHIIPASSPACGDGGHDWLVQAVNDDDPEGVIVAECRTEGDAVLDAAAPKLLAACRVAHKRMSDSLAIRIKVTGITTGALADEVKQLAEAIASAEGGAL
mgnify:CR=1 FL=1